MIDVQEELYREDFTRAQAGANGSPALDQLRRDAFDRFTALGIPTLKNEEWRFTNLAALAKIPFKLAEADGSATQVVRALLPGIDQGQQVIFVNGHYVRDLSRHDAELVGNPLVSERLASYLARHAKFERNAFTALNTAFLRHAVGLYLPKGKVLAEPIHLVYLSASAGEPTVSHPRALIVAEPGSQATIVESYLGRADDVYFTNAVSEIVLGDNAAIDHYKVQREGNEAFHIATLQVHMSRASRFSSHLVSLGGTLVRNETNAVLDGEGCECTLNGVSLASGRQLVDNHTRIDHAKPHCTSHELYKHILDGRAHGVFNGKIYVHPDAQKTDAKQTNQTLLLSTDAVIDTKPQLEIYADDVRCTHGATVGQLDENAIFYLRSRGIGVDESRSLLTFAFANDIVDRIKVGPVRAQLGDVLLAAQGLPGLEGEVAS
jgi:Fe-S cluster assembly protein SufD